MRTLQEKKKGLRWMLRSALVVMSVIALLFVACSGGDGPAGPAGPSGPTGPQGPEGPAIDPSLPTGRYVTNIRVLGFPGGYSYEGNYANLTNAVVELTWSEDGAVVGEPEVVTINPGNRDQFTTYPFFAITPEIAGTGVTWVDGDVVPMTLFHTSNPSVSATILTPVLQLQGISVAIDWDFPGYNLYEDDLINLNILRVMGDYDVPNPVGGGTTAVNEAIPLEAVGGVYWDNAGMLTVQVQSGRQILSTV